MHRLSSFVFAAALVTGAAACNTTTAGANGAVDFTPIECGRDSQGCTFERAVGVGGTLDVHIKGTDGVSTAGATLEAEDSNVVAVEAIDDVGGKPTWALTGVSPGVTRLYAVDGNGDDLDYLEIDVKDPVALRFDAFLGNTVGPDTAEGYDEAWTVNADEATSFFVTPLGDDDEPVLGVYRYQVQLDDALAEGLIDTDKPAEGYLYFQVPAGEYTAHFEDDAGLAFDALITAQ
jgi:hypothetical protein